MKYLALILSLILSLFGGPAAAQDLASRNAVLGCLTSVDTGTTWNQCLTLMFSTCDADGIGTRDHAECLLTLREDWRLDMVARQSDVLRVVTPQGSGDLAELLAAWPTYKEQKCVAVSEQKAEISAIAARLGCEISEMVLISSEFQACIDGRSTEVYCVHAK
jgi:hypothetical protein